MTPHIIYSELQDEETLSGKQLERLLGMTTGWHLKGARRAGIPRVKVGNAWRYPWGGVREWMTEQKVSL